MLSETEEAFLQRESFYASTLEVLFSLVFDRQVQLTCSKEGDDSIGKLDYRRETLGHLVCLAKAYYELGHWRT